MFFRDTIGKTADSPCICGGFSYVFKASVPLALVPPAVRSAPSTDH